jgi:signal transduction histidine kinase
VNENPYQRNVFNLIVVYRWASLIPALFLLARSGPTLSLWPEVWWAGFATLGVVASVNALLSLFTQPLNQLLVRRPYMLAIDLVFTATLLAFSGGIDSPYYLYALNPLLAGAFFFQVRGGLLAAGLFTPLYIGAASVGSSAVLSGSQESAAITQLMGIWLIPVVFGYLSFLLSSLGKVHDDLIAAQDELQAQNESLLATHQQLKTIYDLTVMLQAAPDVESVQEQVLAAAVQAYGFERAALGLLAPGGLSVDSWKVLEQEESAAGDEQPGKIPPVTIQEPENPFSQALQSGLFFWLKSEELDELSPDLSAWLDGERGLLMPLLFHEQPVGILLVAARNNRLPLSSEQTTLLKILANQAATTLGTTLLCVERAQELAVEQERSRIARDIHDTVAQSLFGIVYTLDGCIQMLPEDAAEVRRELLELQDLANQTRDQIRQSIFDLWPSSLTLDVFKTDLNSYIKRCFSLNPFEIQYQVEDLFDELAPAVRRNLYRVTQEALSNVIHHAGVDTARVCLTVEGGWVQVEIEDEGRGFNVDEVLARERNRERFGLHGIQERVKMMGGECAIRSTPGRGTNVSIRVPVNG